MTPLDPSLAVTLLRQSLQQGQQPDLTVTSGSMFPLLKTGDRVRLERVSPADLRPGDIITFQARGQINTHRFWGVIQGSRPDGRLQTRGDRSLTFDQSIGADQLIGRVILRRRGTQILSFQSGPGRWLHRHLAAVTRLETRWARSADVARSARSAPGTRLAHRVLLLWRVVVETAVSSAARLAQPRR